MTYYKPLTPSFREQIYGSIREQEAELNICENTPWVTAQRIALQATRDLINALPDGYPLPVERRD